MGKRGPKPRNPLERMAAMSEWQMHRPELGECLVFTGVTDPKGYGRIGIENRARLTHRVSWLHHFGPPDPKTPWVLHRCDNPPCWNPDHLFAGDHAANTEDMLAKGRHVAKPRAEFCQRNHAMTDDNVSKDGHRRCLACARLREAAFRARKRASL